MTEIIGVVHSKGKKGEYYVPIPENVDITKASFGAIVNEDGVRVLIDAVGTQVDITNRTIVYKFDDVNTVYIYKNKYCKIIISNDFTKDIIIYYTFPEETTTETTK